MYAWNHKCTREDGQLNLAWMVQSPCENSFAVCLGEQQADLGDPFVAALGVSLLPAKDSGGLLRSGIARAALKLAEFKCGQQSCCHFSHHFGYLQRFKFIPAQFMSPFLCLPLG